MTDSQIIEGFWQSIGHAPWQVVIGYVILALMMALKWFTSGKAHGKAEEWISVTVAMVVGIGSALALDSDWIHALVFAALVGGSSSGFWAKVKGLVPEFGETKTIKSTDTTKPAVETTTITETKPEEKSVTKPS